MAMATEDGSSTFNLVGPPRAVPAGVRSRVLFGGFFNQFGWLFFGFGMIFVWAFVGNADLTSFIHFRGELATTYGQVTEGEDTGASVDDTPVYANHYTFTLDGQQYEGVSYATGQQLRKGERCTIEYPPGNPARSRIAGMRTAMFTPVVLFIVVFPLVGLCFIAAGLKNGFKAVRLLRDGLVSYGKLVGKTPTATKINNETVYKLAFEFSPGDGETYTAFAKSHQPAKLEDEEQEPLLYDPFDPSYAALLDSLPGEPRIDQFGAITSSKPGGALTVLLIPMLTAIGNGLYIMWRY